MSGFEVLTAVTGIVSAFNGSLSLYRSWRDRRGDRVSDEQNRQLEYSLYLGATNIQQEYDRYYARLGHRYSSGDGVLPKSFAFDLCFPDIIHRFCPNSASPIRYILSVRH
jgi:hypothetical protein